MIEEVGKMMKESEVRMHQTFEEQLKQKLSQLDAKVSECDGRTKELLSAHDKSISALTLKTDDLKKQFDSIAN